MLENERTTAHTILSEKHAEITRMETELKDLRNFIAENDAKILELQQSNSRLRGKISDYDVCIIIVTFVMSLVFLTIIKFNS